VSIASLSGVLVATPFLVHPYPPADAWARQAADLAAWTESHLVNRRGAFGHYIAVEGRKNLRQTAFTDKSELTRAVLERHYRGRSTGDLIGLHATAWDEDVGACRSRWLGVDIDRHDETVDPEATRRAADRPRPRLSPISSEEFAAQRYERR
jgi:hypothetical protein